MAKLCIPISKLGERDAGDFSITTIQGNVVGAMPFVLGLAIFFLDPGMMMAFLIVRKIARMILRRPTREFAAAEHRILILMKMDWLIVRIPAPLLHIQI